MGAQRRIEIEARKVKDIGFECDSRHEFAVGNFVKIAVSDHGCGIQSEYLEQICAILLPRTSGKVQVWACPLCMGLCMSMVATLL